MGIQVEFVQSPDDEAEFVELLLAKADLLTVPRVVDRPAVEPTALGGCGAARQLVFLATDRDRLVRTIEPLVDVYTKLPKPDQFGVSVTKCRGMYLQWTRTTSPEPNAFVPGRLFFGTQLPASDTSARTLERLFAAAKRHVVKYPMRTDARHSVYVGPHLADGIAQGRYQCVWRAGAKMELIVNAGSKR